MTELSFEDRVNEFRDIIREAAELLNLEIHYGRWQDYWNGPDYWAGLMVYDSENKELEL